MLLFITVGETVVYCSNCGKEVSGKFCSECGEALPVDSSEDVSLRENAVPSGTRKKSMSGIEKAAWISLGLSIPFVILALVLGGITDQICETRGGLVPGPNGQLMPTSIQVCHDEYPYDSLSTFLYLVFFGSLIGGGVLYVAAYIKQNSIEHSEHLERKRFVALGHGEVIAQH